MVTAVNTAGMPIGRALKVERVAAGKSSTEVAAAVGIHVGHLSNIEAGKRVASDELITRIRAAIQAPAS